MYTISRTNLPPNVFRILNYLFMSISKMKTFTSSLALASLAAAFLPQKPGAQTEQFSSPHKLIGNSFGLPSKNASYDFVIAGAGLAGSVVATRLAQAFPNMTVAVVEAGSLYEISKHKLQPDSVLLDPVCGRRSGRLAAVD